MGDATESPVDFEAAAPEVAEVEAVDVPDSFFDEVLSEAFWAVCKGKMNKSLGRSNNEEMRHVQIRSSRPSRTEIQRHHPP